MKIIAKILVFVLTTLLFSCGVSKSIKHQPEISQYNQEIPVVIKNSDSTFIYKNNFLTKNKQQLWEL